MLFFGIRLIKLLINYLISIWLIKLTNEFKTFNFTFNIHLNQVKYEQIRFCCWGFFFSILFFIEYIGRNSIIQK